MTNPVSPGDLPGPRRPSSDALPDKEGYGDFSLDEFFDSMRHSTLWEPHPVRLVVHPWLFDGSSAEPNVNVDPSGEIVIQAVVTSIRLIRINAGTGPDGFSEHYQNPEYEFEAWLIGPFPETIWIRGALRTNDTKIVEECTVYRLNPGEERGTERTPGIY